AWLRAYGIAPAASSAWTVVRSTPLGAVTGRRTALLPRTKPSVMTEKVPRRFVPSARLFCCLLVHGAMVAACAPEPEGPRETLCAGSGCSERCRSLEVERCDTREKDCQSLVFESVRCVRGSDLTALPRTEFVPQTTFSEPHRDELEDRKSVV